MSTADPAEQTGTREPGGTGGADRAAGQSAPSGVSTAAPSAQQGGQPESGGLPPYLAGLTRSSSPARATAGQEQLHRPEQSTTVAPARGHARAPEFRTAPGTPRADLPQSESTAATTRYWRWTPVFAGVAALAWIVAIGLLTSGDSSLAGRVASPRLTLAAAWGIAAALTFVPIQVRLALPGLTWQGVAGWMLMGSILAYVPPPTGWLLDLPDLPVYLLFFLALFYVVAATTLPLTFLVGRRMYAQRMHQLDVRRARRQAYELGLLAVALMVLGGLRVLSPLTGLLLVAVFVLVETLLLSQVAPDG